MAIIRSSLLSDIRGSINGTTYARNRYGAYARNRTTPVNPNTAAQVAARGWLSQSAIAWRGLTDGQRTLWNAYAAGTPTVNKIGETIYLSGQAMFSKYSTWAKARALTAPTVPPVSPGWAIMLTEVDFVVSSSASTLPNLISPGYTVGDTTSASVYAVFVSDPVSPGVTFFKGPWHYVGSCAGDDRASTSFDMPGVVTVGQSFFMKVSYRDAAGKLGTDTIWGPTLATTEV